MATKSSKVTKIRQSAKIRLFLREHRKERGLSASQVAERMGIDRTSVLRLERDQQRLDPQKLANYAYALGIEPPAFFSPPGAISLDALMAGADDDTKAMAADIVRRLVAGQR